MRPRPTGSPVTINPYDMAEAEGPAPEPGDFIVTGAGTVYEVVSSDRIKPRGQLPVGVARRYRLRCIKHGRVDVSPEGRTFPLYWYPRKPTRKYR
jgi:hypothetical protein